VPVDVVSEDAPRDDTVRLIPLDGLPGESVLEVRSGGEVSLTFCDAILNMPRLRGPLGIALAPTGRVSAPRLIRWFGIKDKAKFAAQIDQLAATTGLRRVLFGHGAPIIDDPAGALRSVAAQLRA